MKTISIVVPCYNEEENVEALYNEIRSIFAAELSDYKYEIIILTMTLPIGQGTS